MWKYERSSKRKVHHKKLYSMHSSEYELSLRVIKATEGRMGRTCRMQEGGYKCLKCLARKYE
jgi:hypothetical protein